MASASAYLSVLMDSVTDVNDSESDLNIGIIWAAIGPIDAPSPVIFHIPSFFNIFVAAGLPSAETLASVADTGFTITPSESEPRAANALLFPIATSIGRIGLALIAGDLDSFARSPIGLPNLAVAAASSAVMVFFIGSAAWMIFFSASLAKSKCVSIFSMSSAAVAAAISLIAARTSVSTTFASSAESMGLAGASAIAPSSLGFAASGASVIGFSGAAFSIAAAGGAIVPAGLLRSSLSSSIALVTASMRSFRSPDAPVLSNAARASAYAVSASLVTVSNSCSAAVAFAANSDAPGIAGVAVVIAFNVAAYTATLRARVASTSPMHCKYPPCAAVAAVLDSFALVIDAFFEASAAALYCFTASCAGVAAASRILASPSSVVLIFAPTVFASPIA